MNKLLLGILLMYSTLLLGDIPEKINFSGIIYNDEGSVYFNAPIAVKIQLTSSNYATVYYTETTTVTTDSKGFINLDIGTLTSDDVFSDIDFNVAKGMLVSVDLDISNGISYQRISSESLSSVPFALMAKKLNGGNTSSEGYYAQAWGRDPTASQGYATAWGYNTTASTYLSTAWGSSTNASGNYATAFGYQTTATGTLSMAFGRESNASGYSSTAFGYYTVADKSYMTALGMYNTENNTNALFVVGNGSSGNRSDAFEVFQNGNVYISGSTNVTSDKRLKTNITPISDALSKVKQLNGVTFNWKESHKDQSTKMGVIAQDVQAVFPELVHVGNNGYLSVDYSGMNGAIIEAIKLQDKKIQEQDKKIARLEKENERINAIIKALANAGIEVQ